MKKTVSYVDFSQLSSTPVLARCHGSPVFEYAVKEGRVGESAGFRDAFNALVGGAQKDASALDAAALQKADWIGSCDSFEYFAELHLAEADSLGKIGDGKLWVSNVLLDALKDREDAREL